MTTEERRLAETQARRAHWRRWGPYLSERQWGTVREDYSPSGTAWDAFPHDHARFRAYRWGEDGLLGISDNHQRLCFALALWIEKDPILKERLFGLTGSEGNHGEDVKDYYFYLEPDVRDRFPGFRRRLEWFIRNRPEFREHIQAMARPDGGERRLLSIVTREQLARILRLMLDEREFLSPYGIRAVSQHHRDHPYVLTVDGREHRVDYEPAESSTGLFGGNSNWRGPIWFPINFLLIEALPEVRPRLRPRLPGRVPDGLGRARHPLGCSDRAVARSDPDRPPRPQRAATGPRRCRHVPDRPALAGPRLVLRVLPRRQRGGHRGEPPDRLDGAGCEVVAAERAVACVGGAEGQAR